MKDLSAILVVHLVLDVVLQHAARLVSQPVIRTHETPNRVDACNHQRLTDINPSSMDSEDRGLSITAVDFSFS